MAVINARSNIIVDNMFQDYEADSSERCKLTLMFWLRSRSTLFENMIRRASLQSLNKPLKEPQVSYLPTLKGVG